MDIEFRPLKVDDLLLVHRWLNTPHVMEWWGENGPSVDAVRAKYLPYVSGLEPTRSFVILVDDVAIGYVQTYRIADYPEYAACLAVSEAAAGLDLYIGETSHLHRGLGSGIIRAFLRQVVFVESGIESCIIGPVVTNRAAIRAYEKAGFRYLKTVRLPNEVEPEYLMRITPAELTDD